MDNFEEHFDADEILREPDTIAFDEDVNKEDEATELDFYSNKSIENLDIEEMDDPYL